MKRIEEIINLHCIQLENVRVDFKTKLIQYHINNCIYKYKNKFAFVEVVENFITDLTNIILNNNAKNEKQATEIVDKTREIIIRCKEYLKAPQGADATAIDSTLKYILFQYSKNKARLTIFEQIELLQELKTILTIIEKYRIAPSARIDNSRKLAEQLKTAIVQLL